MEREEMESKVIVACGSLSDKPVLIFGSDDAKVSPFAQSEAYSVVSSSSPKEILAAAESGSLPEAIGRIEGDAVGAVFASSDSSCRFFSKKGTSFTIWNYSRFDGVFRTLASDGGDPAATPVLAPLPSVLDSTWQSLQEKVSVMRVNYDGGVRTFSR